RLRGGRGWHGSRTSVQRPVRLRRRRSARAAGRRLGRGHLLGARGPRGRTACQRGERARDQLAGAGARPWLFPSDADAIRRNTRARGFRDLYAPVRPTDKARQPFVPMRDYVAARRPDGLPADPWLRTHVRAGGSIVKIAPYAMTVVGRLAEWTAWAGRTFEDLREVAVGGRLTPVPVRVARAHAVSTAP